MHVAVQQKPCFLCLQTEWRPNLFYVAVLARLGRGGLQSSKRAVSVVPGRNIGAVAQSIR